MQRVATTVLALVGAWPVDELRALAASLRQGANVRAVLPDPKAAPLDRATAAWGEAARAHIPYLVYDADPLAEVAAAWADRWDGTGDIGRLEVAVQAVLQRWRARSVELSGGSAQAAGGRNSTRCSPASIAACPTRCSWVHPQPAWSSDPAPPRDHAAHARPPAFRTDR